MEMPVRTACACAILALAAGGCGGADDPPDNPGSARISEGLLVTAEEYVFDPNRVTVTGAPARGPAELKITLDNRGDLAHNIVVNEGETEVGGLRSFPGGESRSVSVELERGSYTFVCTVADHEELGMRGTLEVR